MAKRGNKGITTMIAVLLAIVTLVVGLVAGMVVEGTTRALFPVPGTEELENRIDELEDEVAALEDTVDDLNATVETLNPSLVSQAQYIAYALNVTFPLTLTGEIKLGAILSLTGDLATFGENERVAAELAAKQVNVMLEALGAKWTLTLLVEDTQTKPDICLTKVESLAAKGVKLLVGPLSSGEVRAIKTYCDTNKILATSQSSTAPDLAIPDDYIFRFCPTDKDGQGPAVGRIMYDDGKRYIIPVARNDPWGIGLRDAAKTKFEALGGTFLTGIEYSPDATEFSAEASDLNDKVTTALATPGINTTNLSILHISFEEVNAFMTAANAYSVLKTIKWYGSDGTATSGAILEDEDVLNFALAVKYPSTIFAPAHSDKWQMVREHGIAELGREPESYSYAVYDIVWAYALSILVTDQYNATAIKNVLPDVTQAYSGASGKIELDANGDRMAGDYDIWQIIEIATGTYDWRVIGTYVLATDSVVWK